MEMGTGKTRTALELIAQREASGKIDKVLWLCPCSVKKTIAADIQKHADDVDGLIEIYGIESLSSSMRLTVKLTNLVCTHKVFLVVDESILVKNHYAIRTRRITELANQCPYRLILNGTPISKCEKDLFAQWYLLDWRILGYKSFWSFAANHLEYDEKQRGRIRRVLNVDYLTEKIAPYTYQILKSECVKLPEKRYTTIYYDMTEEQEKEYFMVKETFLSPEVLDIDNGSAAIYRAFTALQEVTSGEEIISSIREPIKHEPMFERPEDNPRVECLMDVMENSIDGKCIIWCKYTHEILAIAGVLREKYGGEIPG